MCSRRRKAPSVPASLQRSASASNRRFSLPENWRRLAIATTSGSRRAPSPEAISPAPSATASEPDNPFREDFTNEVMFMSTCTLNCPRQVSHLTLARGDPGRGRTKTGYFWTMARDDRPFGGTDPPAVAYTYAPGRGAVHLHTLLKHYRGIVQCDGYAPYKKLPDDAITLAFCWAHVRRGFFEIARKGNAPIATQALLRIAALYRIEETIRGKNAEQRRAVRRTQVDRRAKILCVEPISRYEPQDARRHDQGQMGL